MRAQDMRLVEMALGGHRGSLQELAAAVRGPLHSYVLRITFHEQIAEDVVQETLLEMLGIFGQLKRAENFWPWLCKIALNKVRNHTRTESRHRELIREHVTELAGQRAPQRDGVAAVIYEEFTQCITQAMSRLSERQRAVLTMRCYEQMSYREIAGVMDQSELACRLLFVRARKKLQRSLGRLGYGRGTLATALALVGKLTAPSEAAAAQVSVAPAMLGGGVLAGGIALVTSLAALKVALVAAVAAGALLAARPGWVSRSVSGPEARQAASLAGGLEPGASHIHEGFYFFPQGGNGPVFTRMLVHEGGEIVGHLQNHAGNYSYAANSRVVTVNNHHYWNPDLSMMLLPTDGAEQAGAESANLFIAVSDDESHNKSFVARDYQAILEERFQYGWPAGADVRDQRDELHRQQWCGFEVGGEVGGQTVTGRGVIPFVCGKLTEKRAWLKLTVGEGLTLVDTPAGAARLNGRSEAISREPAGTYLVGLNRPWMGLHVIDTVRRDAAAAGIGFSARLERGGAVGVVRLEVEGGAVVYELDMERDLIDRIRLFDDTGDQTGELRFEYHSGKDSPSMPAPARGGEPSRAGIGHWLAALAGGGL